MLARSTPTSDIGKGYDLAAFTVRAAQRYPLLESLSRRNRISDHGYARPMYGQATNAWCHMLSILLGRVIASLKLGAASALRRGGSEEFDNATGGKYRFPLQRPNSEFK
ncbi:MAG: hypothetical protein JWR32_4176 [Mycobacterium sp.]|nr:hypothetical protein [Mycobacterium sp.]